MSTTFTAQVAEIFELQTFSGADGRTFVRRRVLLQTVEQYPQRMLITLSNDSATNFSKQVGETVTAHVSFDVNSNKDKSCYFNEIRCWRID